MTGDQDLPSGDGSRALSPSVSCLVYLRNVKPLFSVFGGTDVRARLVASAGWSLREQRLIDLECRTDPTDRPWGERRPYAVARLAMPIPDPPPLPNQPAESRIRSLQRFFRRPRVPSATERIRAVIDAMNLGQGPLEREVLTALKERTTKDRSLVEWAVIAPLSPGLPCQAEAEHLCSDHPPRPGSSEGNSREPRSRTTRRPRRHTRSGTPSAMQRDSSSTH